MTGNKIRQDVQGGDEWGGHADWTIWENDIEKVKAILAGMNPGKVRTAGQTYTAVANRMRTTVELLYNQASKMTEAWSGEPAKKAMDQMQKSYNQANEIYDKSWQSGSAMTRHADMMQSYKDNPPEEAGGGGFMGGVMDVASVVSPAVGAGRAAASNDIADQFMTRLQNDTASSNDGFPAQIRQDMANPGVSQFDPNQGGGHPGGGGYPGGGGGGGMPPGGIGGGSPGGGSLPGGGSPGGGGLPGGGEFPGGGSGSPGGGSLDPLGSGAPGTDLAGAGGGPGSLGGGSLGGGGLGGGAGLGGGVGGGGLGGGVPGGGALGGGVMGGPGGGVGGGAGSGKGGAGRPGMGGGAPMGGQGGGEGEEERERSTWLTEDEDVWGADGDAAPPVIG